MQASIKIRGKISPGPLRGKPLIEKNFYQLVSVMGFEPYKGTLDVKTSIKIDLKRFATKYVDRILQDGKRHIDLYIAPITIIIKKKEEFFEIKEEMPVGETLREKIEELKKRQEQIVRREMILEEMIDEREEIIRHDCFAIQEPDAINKSIIEILDKVNIKEKYGLKDGDIIDIIFYEKLIKRE